MLTYNNTNKDAIFKLKKKKKKYFSNEGKYLCFFSNLSKDMLEHES